MADTSAKLGYGKYNRIDQAITNGVLDARDIIITEDTSEFIYIKDDNTKQIIRSRIKRFDDISSAVEALNNATDTYAGDIVCILDSDTNQYEPYTVQLNSDGETFEVKPLTVSTSVGLTWTKF